VNCRNVWWEVCYVLIIVARVGNVLVRAGIGGRRERVLIIATRVRRWLVKSAICRGLLKRVGCSCGCSVGMRLPMAISIADFLNVEDGCRLGYSTAQTGAS
jgi:hypothetical protein